MLDRWDALRALAPSDPPSILDETPILFLNGQDDSLVLPEMGKEMCAVAGLAERARRRSVVVQGKGHDDVWQNPVVWGKAVSAFLEEGSKNRA